MAIIDNANGTEDGDFEEKGTEIEESDEKQQHGPVVIFISHAHLPPLQPPADLKNDLRNIANPPKYIRDTQTGLSKNLREHLLIDRLFRELLDRAVVQVETHMNELTSTKRSEAVDPPDSHLLHSSVGSQDRLLRVSCFCERGRHRSVTLAEELARKKWPLDWRVEVSHRDLSKTSKRRNVRSDQAARVQRELKIDEED